MLTPTIYLVDLATKHKGYAKDLLLPMQTFIRNYFEPVWKIDCVLKTSPKAVKGAWNMLFIDDADAADALGYHEFLKGFPLAKIFVETTLNDGQDVGVTASHEIVEMLADPSANLTAKGPNGVIFAYETADPVEESSFKVVGKNMTNFVTPEWFETSAHPKGTKYDYLGHLKKPFTLEKGGYAAVQKNGRWTQIYGSVAKERRWRKEDRTGHRNESLRT